MKKPRELRNLRKLRKKGFISEPLTFIFAFIAFVLVALVFFLMISSRSCTSKTYEQTIGSEVSFQPQFKYLAKNFLQTPVSFDVNQDGTEERIPIADLMIWSISNDDYDFMREKLENYFNRYDYYWSIEIEKNDDMIRKISRKDWTRSGEYMIEEFLLPNYDEAEVITAKVLLARGSEINYYEGIGP